MTAQVRVTAVYTQALSNPVWNYVYVYGTGDPSGCDYTQGNNSVMGSPLYVTGNACLYNSAWISGSPLHVKGTLGFNCPQNSVGTPLSPVSGGVHVGGGCKPNGLTLVHSPAPWWTASTPTPRPTRTWPR
jgi:hypothetical protein